MKAFLNGRDYSSTQSMIMQRERLKRQAAKGERSFNNPPGNRREKKTPDSLESSLSPLGLMVLSLLTAFKGKQPESK